MNVENVRKLRDHLAWLREHRPDKFDMAVWLGHAGSIYHRTRLSELADIMPPGEPVSATECGTIACIGGHAAMLGGAGEHEYVPDFAAAWMGLSDVEADNLFMGRWPGGRLAVDASLDEAIDRLDQMLEAVLVGPAG